MSAHGITSTILATGLAEAIQKDGAAAHILQDDGKTKFGPAVTMWIKEVAQELQKAKA